MLRFAKGPDRLFFTTTLQNTVQAYDLEHDRLLDPSFQHPSPPTAFALSSTSHLLLSASASPPVIRLTNLLLNSRSLKLRPQCSSAAVVAVEFHPERGNIFILAFADATCAVYDAAYIFQAGNRGQRGSDASVSGTGWEIAHIKNLHAPGKATIGSYEDSHTGLNTGDIPERITDNNRTAGVLAVGFVPGLKTIVVTVGLDGRCCVVDFAATEAHTATVICAWDITGSPTSLSILSPSPKENLELPIARLRDQDSAHRPKIVAIGCQDGEVLLFDLAGELLRQQILGPATLRVIDVEWMEGGDWPEPSLIQPTRNDTSKSRSRRNRRSIGAVLASGRPVEEEVVAISNDSVAGQGTGEALTKALSEAETPLSSVSNKDIPARDNATVRWVSFRNLTQPI